MVVVRGQVKSQHLFEIFNNAMRERERERDEEEELYVLSRKWERKRERERCEERMRHKATNTKINVLVRNSFFGRNTEIQPVQSDTNRNICQYVSVVYLLLVGVPVRKIPVIVPGIVWHWPLWWWCLPLYYLQDQSQNFNLT